MNLQNARLAGLAAKTPRLLVGAAEPIGFPTIYAVVKWVIVISLIFLAVLAAAFWTLVLGGFAGSGFRTHNPADDAVEKMVITPECAWPYDVNDHDAKAVCRMFYNLTPEQRAQALSTRKVMSITAHDYRRP
jgi:hypothetical protein